MLRRPPRSTLFPTRRSSDLCSCIWLTRRGPVTISACASRLRNRDRKSTRLNSSHLGISYAVFCLKKKTDNEEVDAATLRLDRGAPVIGCKCEQMYNVRRQHY